MKALVSIRLKHEQDFRNGRQKKSVLWKKIETELKATFPSITHNKDTIQRKFINLLTTYKRIKARNATSGNARSWWDFFEDFDEVYGTRHSVDVPEENLLSSLDVPPSPQSNSSTTDSPVTFEGFTNEASSSQALFSTPKPAKRKRRQDETESTIDFLKEEAKKDDTRFSELLKIENERLEIEKQKLTEMKELKNIMKQLLPK